MTTLDRLCPDLPAHLERHPDESAESYLERVAEANWVTHPELLRTLNDPALGSPRRPAPAPGVRPSGWTPSTTTHICSGCLAATGVWFDAWRHPMATVCLFHGSWLSSTCPACHHPYRAHSHHQLRSVDARHSTCGNPTGHRGQPCSQELASIPTTTATPEVLASQRRIQTAIARDPVTLLGQLTGSENYLTEVKALAVLLLHLACQPQAPALASWASDAAIDAQRTTGPGRARWGLAPPADPSLRGHALAAADHILDAPDLETAADRLHPWTELTPPVPEGQLGWLADHTRMTPLLTRLVMAATASRRRVSTLLDQHPPEQFPISAIPQTIPAEFFEVLAPHVGSKHEHIRGYASLCLARRHSTATTWPAAGTLLGIPTDAAVTIARTGSHTLTAATPVWLAALDRLATQLDPDIDYRQREIAVVRLSRRSRWYRRWARQHHPGSPAVSRGYAITWLWTHWAHALLATTPAWATPPDGPTRTRYGRYIRRLDETDLRALILYAELQLGLRGRP